MNDKAPSWPDVLGAIAQRRELRAPEIAWVMEEMMQGRAGDAEMAGFLIGLRARGETPGEVAAAAQVLRHHMLAWDPGRSDVLDTCGTGGDQSGVFNISTATAFVVAGAGVPVVKHGNRSVSSRSGSADVLVALGVAIEGDGRLAFKKLHECGLAFCFAPVFHPAMRHVAAVRKRLGVPSIFNLLGPLANPAGARRQLIGVSRPEFLDLLAEALARLGAERSLVVHGAEGLDEVSLAGVTNVREVIAGAVREAAWTPEDFGLAPVDLADVRVADAEESAAMIRDVLRGSEGPALRLVLANAAAALIAAGKADVLRDGVALARDAIRSGRALAALERLRAGRDT